MCGKYKNLYRSITESHANIQTYRANKNLYICTSENLKQRESEREQRTEFFSDSSRFVTFHIFRKKNKVQTQRSEKVPKKIQDLLKKNNYQ